MDTRQVIEEVLCEEAPHVGKKRGIFDALQIPRLALHCVEKGSLRVSYGLLGSLKVSYGLVGSLRVS